MQRCIGRVSWTLLESTLLAPVVILCSLVVEFRQLSGPPKLSQIFLLCHCISSNCFQASTFQFCPYPASAETLLVPKRKERDSRPMFFCKSHFLCSQLVEISIPTRQPKILRRSRIISHPTWLLDRRQQYPARIFQINHPWQADINKRGRAYLGLRSSHIARLDRHQEINHVQVQACNKPTLFAMSSRASVSPSTSFHFPSLSFSQTYHSISKQIESGKPKKIPSPT